MPRRLHLEVELPDEVLTHVRDEEIASKAKEALVMELLREQHISQGKAAELLGMHRHDLFDLMGKYKVPAIDMTEEELREELHKPLPRSK
jgi:predicted HTH domain antitoxin